jgi:hypothetical protein
LRRNGPEPISATEIACWAYCQEQWRLEHGLGLLLANQAALDHGTRHHARTTMAERFAGKLIVIGQVLMLLAVVALVLWGLLR